MRYYRRIVLRISFLLVLVFIFGCHHRIKSIKQVEHIPRITKEELKPKLGDPAVSIIDVRYGSNWKKSERLISGAVREEPMEVGSWIDKYPKDQMIVLYCD